MSWGSRRLKLALLVVTAAAYLVFAVLSTCGVVDVAESPVPCCVFILLMPWIVAAGIAWQRKPAHPAGHCHQCGYDLTGNVSGICPECGTPIPTPASGQEALAEESRKRHAVVQERMLLACVALVGLFCAYNVASSWHHPLGLRGTVGQTLPALLVLILLIMVYVDQCRRR